MAKLTAECSCGHTTEAPSNLAGKYVRCSACKGKLKIPMPILHTHPIKRKCSCGAILESPSSMAGKNIQCPVCSKKMRLDKTITHSTPISGICPHCEKVVKAPGNLAGKSVRCPSCQQGKISFPKALVNSTPIHAKCFCGHTIDAPGESAGKRIRCPSCKIKVRLPRVIASEEENTQLTQPEIRMRIERDETINLDNIPVYNSTQQNDIVENSAEETVSTQINFATEETKIPLLEENTFNPKTDSSLFSPIGKENSPKSTIEKSKRNPQTKIYTKPYAENKKNPLKPLKEKESPTFPQVIEGAQHSETLAEEEIFAYEPKSTLFQQIVIGAIVLFGLIFVIFLFSNATKFTSALRYLPSHCNMIGSLKIEPILSISLIDEFLRKNRESSELKLAQKYGFGPENIISIYFGANGDLSGIETGNVFILTSKKPLSLSGLFEELKIQFGFQVKTSTISGYTMYHDPSDSGRILIGQPKDTMLIFGSPLMVEESLRLFSNDSQSSFSSTLLKMMDYQERPETFWIASTLPEIQLSGTRGLPIAIENIEGIIFHINYYNGIICGGKIVCKDLKTASKLSMIVNQLVNYAIADPKGFLSSEYFNIQEDGKELKFEIEIPERDLKKLQQYFPTEIPGFPGLPKKETPPTKKPK